MAPSRVRLLATLIARALLRFRPPENKRAQGMPDARCTRDLMCNGIKECAHEHTGQRRTSDIPCAMALRLISCSPQSGRARCHCRSSEALASSELDASIGASGPHDFTVRLRRARQSQHRRPPLPAPTFVTMANAPLSGTGWQITSGLIPSEDSQIDRSSSSSRHESRNCRKGHPGGPPST